jgi:TonB family protein
MTNSSDRKSIVLSGLAAGAAHLLVAAAAICALAYGFDYASHVNEVYLVSGESAGDQPALSVRRDSNPASVPSSRQVITRVLEKAEQSLVAVEAKKVDADPQSASQPGTNSGAPHALSVTQGNRAPMETVEFASPSGPGWKRKVEPVYPLIARRMNKEGKVLLKLTIDENGKLLNADVVEDAGYGFTEAALDAVKKSTYRPARKNGVYASALALLSVKFSLTD